MISLHHFVQNVKCKHFTFCIFFCKKQKSCKNVKYFSQDFCFFIISFTYFSTSFAAPQIPASFASSASANSVSLSAKNAISLNGSLM